MAEERFRVFKGATELSVANVKFSRVNDEIIPSAKLFIYSQSSPPEIGDVLPVRKADGSTKVFEGAVLKLTQDAFYEVTIYGLGYELMTTRLQKKYTNISPEGIVEDAVDNFTRNLTYASTESSGIVLEEYIADGYLIDIIRDMKKALRWFLRFEVNGNVFFNAPRFIDNGKVFTNGVNNVRVIEWRSTNEFLINQIEVVGGFREYQTTETVSGTGTEFTLTHKPIGAMKAIVSSSEVSPNNYEVDAEGKEITFDSSQTDPEFTYTYARPITVQDRDEASIELYDLVSEKRINAPFLNTRPDVRRFAKKLLQEFAYKKPIILLEKAGLHYDVSVNERVTIEDPVRNKSATSVVLEIKYDFAKGATFYRIGSLGYEIYTWQTNVLDRIKTLERTSSSSDLITVARTLRADLQEQISWEVPIKIRGAGNAYTINHETLGVFRDDENHEVDCTLNGTDGDFTGSGSFYESPTYVGTETDLDDLRAVNPVQRLGCAVFNGSDDKCTCRTSVSNCRAVSVFLKPTANNSSFLQLASGVSIELDASGDISTTGLSNVSVWVDNVSATQVGTATTKHVYIEFDAVTADDIVAGNAGSSYYEGKMDELVLFNDTISSDTRTNIINNNFGNYSSEYSKAKLWWAFDNPKYADTRSTQITIQTLTS